MAIVLREPKRKHRGGVVEHPPFPILTERATGIPVCETTWRTYTGRFNGDSVTVEKLEDISALYSMGYYGKGSLSRGCTILIREKRKQPQFLKERRWLRHELWMEMAASNSERGETSVISGKQTETTSNTKKNDSDNPPEGKDDSRDLEKKDKSSGEQSKKQDKSSDEQSKKQDTSSDEQSKKQDKSSDEQSKKQDESSDEQSKKQDKSSDEQSKKQDKSSDEQSKKQDKSSDEQSKKQDKSSDEQSEKPASANITGIDDADSECSDIVEVDKCGTAASRTTKRASVIERGKQTETDVKRRRRFSEERMDKRTDIEVVDLSSDEDSPRPASTAKSSKTPTKSSGAKTGSPEPGCSSSMCDPVNRVETEVVVLSEVDSEDEDYVSKFRPRIEYEPTYLAREKLVLSLEEAMFLSYGLGCLRVLGLNGRELSLLELWKLFQESQKTFIQRYIAYHYFRSKGWIVKSGLKFGGDFALYKDGPHTYHSSYVVVVEVINQGTSMRDNAPGVRPMTWTQWMGLNRLSEAAGKEVLICQVVWPADVRKDSVTSPRVVSSFQVHEVLLRRWVPSQDRTDHLKNREVNVSEEISTETISA